MKGAGHFGATLAIAGFAMRSALRQRVYSVVGALAFVLVLGSLVFRTFEFGADELGFLADFGLGVIFFFGSMLAVLLPSLRWFEELNDRTVLPILARPVSRASFFFGQWAGAAGALTAFVLGMTVVLMGLLVWRASGIEDFAPEEGFAARMVHWAGVLTVAGLLQLWRLWLISAFTLLLGSFARGALYTATLAFIFVLGGQLLPLAESVGPTLGTGAVRMLFETGTSLFANLGAFAIDGGEVLREGVPGARLSALGLHTAIYLAAYLVLGGLLFQRRDL